MTVDWYVVNISKHMIYCEMYYQLQPNFKMNQSFIYTMTCMLRSIEQTFVGTTMNQVLVKHWRVGWLILCANLTGPGGAQRVGQILFWVSR